MKLLQHFISLLVQIIVIIYKVCAFLLSKFIGLDKLEASTESSDERPNSQSTTASSLHNFSQTNLSPCSSPSTRGKMPVKEIEPQKSDTTFRDISVIKSLNKAKFQIYLVRSKVNREQYAMKVFPFSGNLPHNYFRNESRFSFFDHNNVIKIHHTEKERETKTDGIIQRMSYIVMEYAPYGDMFEFVMRYTTKIDDRLIRTYFRQMIEGLEYLHHNGVSHMDLKLENLLLGHNYQLKIADFDLSHFRGDSKIFGRGTKSYSAPEVIEGTCKNTYAADIYSAGIILFTMRTRGLLPYAEGKKIAGVDFEYLLHNDNQKFWNKHCEIREESESYFEEDFKRLFNSMVNREPGQRVTIAEIKRSKWYNGPYYTDREVKQQVENILFRRNV